jgi:NAD(P)H dehydrogenase (quinone)
MSSSTPITEPIVLVSSANGNVGFPATKELLELGFQVRAFVRNPDNPKARELEALGAELFVGDIEDIRDVRRALDGVKRAYFAPTPPNMLFQGCTFATASEEMGLEHVVVMTQWISSNTHPSTFTKEHWLVDQTFKRLANVGVTFINPGLFAMVYLLDLEPVSQFGMFPEFGSNAPPSNEDMGAVVAHILKDPAKHEGLAYRVTGPDLLTSQEMGDIIGKILGRKVTTTNVGGKMMLKAFRAGGFSLRDVSQIGSYFEEARKGTFALGAPTDVVRKITGRQAEGFETIARRFISSDPKTKQTLSNKLRAILSIIKVLFTPAWNIQKYEQELKVPKFNNMMFAAESNEW